MPIRPLSTIEMSVLGLAWLRGPCTTYAIMKELSSSGSTYYKSRAGTTYSVTDRLLRFGFLETADGLASDDKLIRVTAFGEERLRDWIRPPTPMYDIAFSADLLRLRFFYIGILEPSERLAFIDDAIASLKKHLVRCEALIPENEAIGDHFGALATLSVVFETKARIEWLETVRSQVEALGQS